VLGDDAIGCLKDLRRWIKFYDEKLGRLDVQRVLAESNFVKGDILEILGDWPETAAGQKLRSKISLLCCEFARHNIGDQDLPGLSGTTRTIDMESRNTRPRIYRPSPQTSTIPPSCSSWIQTGHITA
jgi:hypothetical protein